jgi:hypothetical protein
LAALREQRKAILHSLRMPKARAHSQNQGGKEQRKFSWSGFERLKAQKPAEGAAVEQAGRLLSLYFQPGDSVYLV